MDTTVSQSSAHGFSYFNVDFYSTGCLSSILGSYRAGDGQKCVNTVKECNLLERNVLTE